MLLRIFFCFIAFLSKLTFGKNLPYANIGTLIGHINFIIPTQNLINNFILLSSFSGNIGLLNYKTGTLKYVKNHRDNEKVKKLHGDDKYATVLIYKNNFEEDSKGNYTKDENVYSYINVYDIVESYLLSVFEYKNEIIEDFLIKEEKIYILLQNRIDIGNINDSSTISINFKELNLNSIYTKIVVVNDNKITLFYVDTSLFCYIVNIDALNKTLVNLNKIKELQINDKINNYVSGSNSNKNVIIIYNKKYLHWIELLSEENKYYYNNVIINDENENTLFVNEINGKNKFIMDDGMDQWNTENYFVLNIGGNISVYSYNSDNKQMNVVGKRKKKNSEIVNHNENVNEHVNGHVNGHANEIVGYYINKNHKKDFIFAEDNNGKILIKKAKKYTEYNDDKETNNDIVIKVLNKTFEKKKKKKTKKYPYSTKFHIIKELEKYVKDKLNSFNKSYLDEVMNIKAELSLLPFNFFYLSNEEKMSLLNICKNKKLKSESLINSKKGENTNFDTQNSGNYKFNLMRQMLQDSFEKYEHNHSSKYAGSSVVLVSTCNNIIFAIHLYTGLILYKMDGNILKGTKHIFSLKRHLCSFSFSNHNWAEIDNGKKIIFSDNANENTNNEKTASSTDEHSGKSTLNLRNNEIFLFKSFSKDSVITIFKSNESSHIVIFDILNGDILFKKKLDSFAVENIFVYKKNSSIIAVDNLLNTKIMHVNVDNSVIENINDEELFLYSINKSKNFIQGYKLINLTLSESKKSEVGLIQTYSIKLNDEKIEVFSKTLTEKDLFYPIKINKDASICYKYINDNIISYITKTLYEKRFIYSLYIIDGISGSLIYSKILDKYAHPPFHLVISENMVVLNYYNVNLNKYIIQIFEILLDRKDPGFLNLITSKKEKLVDLFDEKEIIVNEKNYVIDHNIKSFKFTETKRGITNKHILLLLDTNRIAALNVGLNEEDQNVYKDLNTFITQTDILYNSKGFISNESLLESTTLVFSWGNYLYFTCYQPNGSYDTIENFNLLLLLFLIILVFVGTYFSYIVRMNKELYSKWE
ncbi:ER membrane protein complex subunit 1 [Plasmodium brasilianum]|uniref:ER membrane protein complex subunit 1 n=1 Tax=Plasmodium brasilianum TaxID=5824 RepID=A0ACB9Y133_PLABR|nr:ER membrane protein complex subunit 1 [Plasmodium brasilianum]